MSQLAVTVIMAVYNSAAQESTLRTAVDSILKQTFTDFELIVCDDGSMDDTWDLLQEIQKTDHRIHILHNEENRRAGYARNTCLKQAKGKYIAIMDSDDISRNDRLQLQYDFLEQHSEYGFVGSRGEFFIQNPGDDKEIYWYCEAPEPEDFLFSLPYVHASCMFRKEVLDRVQGYDCSKNVIRTEDYDMLLRIYGEQYRGYNLPEVLYYIRRDEAQYARRKYRFRINEAHIKYRGYRKMGLMPKALPYVVKPLIVGLIPIGLMAKIQKRYYRKKQ